MRVIFSGSILKRMVKRKRSRMREICVEEIRVSVKDVLNWESFKKGVEVEASYNEKGSSNMGFSCSCNISDWTESKEEKSMDLESSSCESEEFEALELVAKERRDDDFLDQTRRNSGSVDRPRGKWEGEKGAASSSGEKKREGSGRERKRGGVFSGREKREEGSGRERKIWFYDPTLLRRRRENPI